MAEMTKKDFWELLEEFAEKMLDPNFQQIDSRFEQIDSRFQKIDDQFEEVNLRASEFKEDILHQFRIASEGLRSEIKQVAEGVMNLNEKLDHRMIDVVKEIKETRQ